MTETKITQRLRAAIRSFIESTGKKGAQSESDRARFFRQQKQPALCEQFLLERIEALMQSEAKKIEERNRRANPEEEAQMQFLGEDFTSLFTGPGHRLPIKGGLRRQFLTLTVAQLRQAAIEIRARITPRARQQAEYLERLADQMSPYAQVHRKITVADYLEVAAAGITPEPARK